MTGYLWLLRVVCPQCHRHLPYLLHCISWSLCPCVSPSLSLVPHVCLTEQSLLSPFSLSTPWSFVLFSVFLLHLCFLHLSYYFRSYLSFCVYFWLCCTSTNILTMLGKSLLTNSRQHTQCWETLSCSQGCGQLALCSSLLLRKWISRAPTWRWLHQPHGAPASPDPLTAGSRGSLVLVGLWHFVLMVNLETYLWAYLWEAF